jgi:hypothetical protein
VGICRRRIADVTRRSKQTVEENDSVIGTSSAQQPLASSERLLTP